MKKTAIFALLLAMLMTLTACGGPATFAEAKTEKYLTLGEYKGIAYTPADTTVSDYEVTVALNDALNDKGYAKIEKNLEIKEGTVQIGDKLNIDYKGLKDGVAFSGGTAEDQSLTIGSGQFIDGFEEGLVGKAVGSEVKLNLTFPEDYGNAELNGAAVVFEVKINYVEERTSYPELTDEIANDLDEEVKTAKEYMANLRTGMENEKKATAEETEKNDLWNTVLANVKFEEKLPEKLVKNSVKEFTDYYEAVAKQNSFTSLEDFVKAQNMTMETFEKQAQSYGENIVKSQLTAYAIAKAEGYAMTKEILDSSAESYAAKYGYSTADEYIKAVGEEAVADQAILDYAVDVVLENAKTK